MSSLQSNQVSGCLRPQLAQSGSCARSLARTSHVDKKVIGPFVRLYWDRQGSEQERLEAACAELEAEGLPVTMVRLCSRAHVGSKAAAAFLRNYHPVVRPKSRSAAKPARSAKASPQERLSEAYTRLVARGEQVTRVHLRQARSCEHNVQVTHTQTDRQSSSEHRQA